jgi:hypothetical protein
MQYTEKVNVSGDSSRFPNDFFNDQMDAMRNVPAKAIEAGILFVAAALAPEDVRHEHEVGRVAAESDGGGAGGTLAGRARGGASRAHDARPLLGEGAGGARRGRLGDWLNV